LGKNSSFIGWSPLHGGFLWGNLSKEALKKEALNLESMGFYRVFNGSKPRIPGKLYCVPPPSEKGFPQGGLGENTFGRGCLKKHTGLQKNWGGLWRNPLILPGMRRAKPFFGRRGVSPPLPWGFGRKAGEFWWAAYV